MFLYKIFIITLVLSLITLPNYGLHVHKLGERKLDDELVGRKLEKRNGGIPPTALEAGLLA